MTNQKTAIREDVTECLHLLFERCGEYEHTTHGLSFFNGVTIQDVCKRLVETYETPSSCSVSSLSQTLAAFLKQEAAK